MGFSDHARRVINSNRRMQSAIGKNAFSKPPNNYKPIMPAAEGDIKASTFKRNKKQFINLVIIIISICVILFFTIRYIDYKIIESRSRSVSNLNLIKETNLHSQSTIDYLKLIEMG